MKRSILYFILLALLCQPLSILAQSKLKASVPFSYLPDASEDRYNQQITRKTIPLNTTDFVILSKSTGSKYAVEKYNQGLKKVWTAVIDLTGTETVEAFSAGKDAALVVTRRDNGQGSQLLYGHAIDLATGKSMESKLLLEAPARGRRARIITSPDGNFILACRYQTDGNEQIRNISGTLYNSSLRKIQDVTYSLNNVPAILSADVQVSNTGEQYISLISENMTRLTVHQYSTKSKEAVAMSVLVGGLFEGKKVYIMDSKFTLMPNGTLYGAVFIADETSGQYHSLKTVKFDFDAKDMVFAEEYKFTPDYLAKVNAQDKSAGPKPSRLEDIYLSDLLLTAENKLIVIAEKKYLEAGENSPYVAKELHLFAYDEFMNAAWNSVLLKSQRAASEDAFSGISYSAYVDGATLNLLTLEDLSGKYDLHLRRINTANGQATAAKAIGLNVANDKGLAYVKDFTSWLTPKDIITVVRPGRRAQGLKLSHVQLR